MVAARGVRYYLDAVKAILHVWVLWNPKLFADLAGNLGVVALYDRVSKCGNFLTLDLPDDIWQLEFDGGVSSFQRPRFEPPFFPVVIASSHVQLWSNQDNLLIQTVYPAIVQGILVNHRHADVAEQILSQFLIPQDICQHFPAVPDRVQLEEMILTAIARNFQFRP